MFEDMIRTIIREELEPLRKEVQELRAEMNRAKAARKYLTAEQVAERIGASRTAIYEWARSDPSFPGAYKFGNLMRFEVSDLERWEDAHRVRKEVTA